jgi:hypothetical protein
VAQAESALNAVWRRLHTIDIACVYASIEVQQEQ